jgi:hypothetical protein
MTPGHQPLFYISLAEGEVAGPYDLAQMASMLRQNIISAETLTFMEGEENWIPFGERGHFIIAQEIPPGADSMQLAQKEEEEASRPGFALPSTDGLVKMAGMIAGLLIIGTIIYFVSSMAPMAGLVLLVVGLGAGLVGQCLIYTRLVEEDLLTQALVLLVPFGDVYYFLANLGDYLVYFCAKYIGIAVVLAATWGLLSSTSPDARDIVAAFGLAR